MKKWISISFLFILAVALTAPAPARAQASNEAARLTVATKVLNEITATPDNGIPESLLAHAQGVAVIPNVIKAAFGIGGRWGEGVLTVRQPDGSWSQPVFIRLAGGSVGWQIGAQSTDVVLVFKTARSLNAIEKGKFTLGGDVSVAGGPVGRYAEASTDAQLRAEILSYSRNRGLFAGISLAGAVIQIDNRADMNFYGRQGANPNAILASRISGQTPRAATRFTCTVAAYTRSPMRFCA
jgi:lipid-binding SYLF domain-containing protein